MPPHKSFSTGGIIALAKASSYYTSTTLLATRYQMVVTVLDSGVPTLLAINSELVVITSDDECFQYRYLRYLGIA